MSILAGIDIGGTKCAVSIGKATDNSINIITKKQFPTPESPQTALNTILEILENLSAERTIDSIGISCGSPLDSKRGIILSPPNLPNWDHIDVITPFQNRFEVPVGLQNDANACALAEWKWGAGKGCQNMVFLTFGTGMGAGLILNGRLYSGTNDNAGEVGHVRLEDDGPIGYGKAGSFEGFCSGGGIAQLAQAKAKVYIANGGTTLFCNSMDDIHLITTKKVGEAAQSGDPLAIEIFQTVAKKLGKGLAIIVDILNPEKIVIGSIYGRQQSLLEPITMEVVELARNEVTVPIVRIDEAMAEEAIKRGNKIGVIATLSTTMNPTLKLLKDTAKKLEKKVDFQPDLAEEAYKLLISGDQKGHDALLVEHMSNLSEQTDIVVLAQASMARSVPLLEKNQQRKFLTSPKFGIMSVKQILEE